MESLIVETFNPDMIKVINSEQNRAGDINYTSVKFTYDRGKIPPLKIDGKFRLFRFKNSKRDIYSLSIKVVRSSCPRILQIGSQGKWKEVKS